MAAVIHLDTNILIFGLNPAHPMREQVRVWLERGENFAVSAMAWAEFLCGPVSDEAVRAWDRLLVGGILPLERSVAESAAVLFNLTGRRTRSLPDCVIAATAIDAGAKLATLNGADFKLFVEHGLLMQS